MNLWVQKALINDVNLKFFGVDLHKLYASSGKLIADKLSEMYGLNKSYVFVCGLGGNASDGLSTAINLIELGAKSIDVYIVGRVNYSGSTIFKALYNQLDKVKTDSKNLTIKQDCYAEDIVQKDIVVESLVGTGLEGSKLNKRFHDCVNRISHFKSKMVAIDIPAPSYTPDDVISLNYPKTDTSIVIDIPESKDASLLCGPGEVKFLFNSKERTHKLKNGKILYISSTTNKNEFEHIGMAAKNYSCNLYIYNFNTELKELKGFNFINDLELEKYYNEADTILIGSIDEQSAININLVQYIVKLNRDKKYVLTWNILSLLNTFKDLEFLKESILLLNRSTVDSILKEYGVSERSLSQVIQSNIFFSGFQNTMYSKDGEYKVNINPKLFNQNSTQALANIAACILTKNDPWLTLKASVFLFEVAQKLSAENKKNIEENLKEAISLCKDY